MRPNRKKKSEENQPEKGEPKRAAKAVPLNKQEIILKHRLEKNSLNSLAEELGYEAGHAAAELFLAVDCATPRPKGNTAEDVLAAIYQGIESGGIDLVTANRIRSALEETLRERNNLLRKKLAAKSKS